MWLDRLSGHSTPASAGSPPPANRSYSPAPRRQSNLGPPSALQRPGFNPRSSSLSLISNDSTTSLLSSRRPNGSNLKRTATTVNASSPLEVLDRIVRDDTLSVSKALLEREASEDFELELDFDGLGLHEIAEGQRTLGGIVLQSIEECMRPPRIPASQILTICAR